MGDTFAPVTSHLTKVALVASWRMVRVKARLRMYGRH